jgi:hypothetical protein
MSDEKQETDKASLAVPMGLETDAAALLKLGKVLSNAAKARAFGRSDYPKLIEEAARLAAQVNWTGLTNAIEREVAVTLQAEETNLSSRREKLLQTAAAAQWQTRQGERFDRIDIWQVEYEGTSVVLKLGGVLFERIKETDAKKVFELMRQFRTALDNRPFQREAFFKLLKDSHAHFRRAADGGDDFVPIRDLHREMVLERARTSERFRKSAEPKNIEPYPLTQFIFDLARFVRGGVAVGGERIVTQTPSMRQAKDTIHIPNLDNPMSSETAAARLAIRPA